MPRNLLIVITLVILGVVLAVSIARAPEYPEEVSPTSPNVPGTPTQPSVVSSTTARTSTTGTTQTYVLGTAKSVVLKMGQPILLGKTTVALTNIEDSRCGEGNTCIWAGEVKARLSLESGGVKKDLTLVFPGNSQTILGRTYKVISVNLKYPTAQKGSYEVYISTAPLIPKRE